MEPRGLDSGLKSKFAVGPASAAVDLIYFPELKSINKWKSDIFHFVESS